MQTLQKQTLQNGEEELTYSQEASPASLSVKQEREKAQQTPATFGPKCSALYEKFAPDGSWERMFMDLLIGTGEWYSTRCALNWQMKASKSSRLFCLLQASTPRTNGKGSSLLPTVTAQDFKRRGPNSKQQGLSNTENWAGLLKTPTAMDVHTTSGKANPVSGNSGTLAQEIMSGYEPTMEKLGLLPTPATRDYKGARTTEALEEAGRNHTNSLPDYFAQTGKSFQLNPLFVAEMMGFPPDWTVLPFQSGDQSQ
jgi:hypothetical protein